VTAVFPAGSETEIAGHTGWQPTAPGSDGTLNSIKVSGSCMAEGAGYTSTGSTSDRYGLPLWGAPGGAADPDHALPWTAFSAVHHETLRHCGWTVDAYTVSGDPSGFDTGRRELAQRYQPNPVGVVYWGNSRSITQCSGQDTVVSATNGHVALAMNDLLFGYNEDWHFLTPPPGIDPVDLADRGGSTSARLPLSWALVEPTRDAPYDWSRYDAVIPEMVSRGIAPILSVGSAPGWAVDNSNGDPERCDPNATYLPPDPHYDQDWKDFLIAVAQRYPQVAAIEIWNEPNQQNFWGECPPNSTRYTRLLELADEAFQGAGIAIPTLVAGMSPVEADNDPNHQRGWVPFLQEVKDRATGKPWDGVGLHPYRTKEDKQEKKSWTQAAKRQYRRVRRLKISGQVWVTEVGVVVQNPAKPNDPLVVGTPENQRDQLLKIYAKLSSLGVRSVIIHRLKDVSTQNPPPGTPQGQFYAGVIDENYVCKLAFEALAAARNSPIDC